MEQIKAAIQAFVQGGDTNDVALLNDILHPHFQNIQDGHFTEKGIYVFSKSEYIELVGSKKFGGNPRTIHWVSIEQRGNIVIAKVELESSHLKFFSTIVCVCVAGQWYIMNNIPTIQVKS